MTGWTGADALKYIRENPDQRHNSEQAYACRCPECVDRNPRLSKRAMRSEARHFIAEQECDDLRELTIRAKNHAMRISSTLPARESRAFVASFVGAVENEYRVAARDYNFDHYMQYAQRNGLHPGDKLTVDRYSREHGVPQERAHDYALQYSKTASRRHASLTPDFPAEFIHLD